MTTPADYAGFRVVGGADATRQAITWLAAFVAHCDADPECEPEREAYLSLFTYGPELPAHIKANKTTRGYRGPAAARWLWLDIDSPDPDAALAAARRLVGHLLHDHPGLDENDLLLFFSGRKGFHIALPLPARARIPDVATPSACKLLAAKLSIDAGVTIDLQIYEPVRLFRAPNSRHPKTGLYKVRLGHDELMKLSDSRIRELAQAPRPSETPALVEPPATIAALWDWAVSEARSASSKRAAAPPGPGDVRVTRDTLEFIRTGAVKGERNNRLFRAAANLGEFSAPEELVLGLLEESALDSGLPPQEVRATICSGLDRARRQRQTGVAT